METSKRLKAKALYDFEPQAPGEIGIWANETVTVINKDVGEGWCEGINSRGETGLFPENYIELISSPPPPSMPPPPLPHMYTEKDTTSTSAPATFDNGDDWDDDWDDDDSNQGSQDLNQHPQLSGPGNFGLSLPNRPTLSDIGSKGDQSTKSGTVKRFNRFSNFVKSGGEAWLLGSIKPQPNSLDAVQIMEHEGEMVWSPNKNPYLCEVSSPKKESKLKGLKSFIAYQITPSFNQIPVSRRYKHFDWLHERLQEKFSLIPVPPLPDKQISGRYAEEFIEHRMALLQLWVSRICRHPVLSQCSVWMHFLTCRDDKQWKLGKRKAEKDDLLGAHVFAVIQCPQSPGACSERCMEAFSKFSEKMDVGVNSLYKTAHNQMKKCSQHYKQECLKIANSLGELVQAFELDKTQRSTQLTEALKHTGDTYRSVGDMYENKLKHCFEAMGDVLYEYKGILAVWPEVISYHKSFLNKNREYHKLRDEAKLSADELDGINQRTDVVSFATMAEISHFQQERVLDFNAMMYKFLGGQIEFYEEVVRNLRETQQHFAPPQ
ncbi:sorting nexin lst-4-like [Ornithodoros turicata]|uniref:sorting nexin lst-4-like n=1 Tax=Ornithodoros turicata TaxID=34597 RepID=UPI003138E2DF